MLYFTSDTHFFHRNIIHLCNRPFDSLDAMHEELIARWNTRVTNRDEIYILGDFGFRGTGAESNGILSRLNGRKYLLRGNHDQFLDDPDFDEAQFEWIKDYHSIKYQKRKFVLFHYPIWEWDGYCSGAIHLFGHIHYDRKAHAIERERSTNRSFCFSVCSDVCGFAPVSIDEIMAAANDFERFEGFNGEWAMR